MYIKEDYSGKIKYSQPYLTELVSNAVSQCFGVSGICTCHFGKRIINFLLMGTTTKKGVYIRAKNNKLTVDIHIEVVFGTNIPAIKESVAETVYLVLEEATSPASIQINIYVDNVK